VREAHLEKDPKGRIKIMEHGNETENVPQPMMLPLFGPISAGFAAPVEEQAEEMITLDNYLIGDKASTFLLRVKGDSMMDAGIYEGDIVVVNRKKTPKLNDIVVGVLDGEFTLKRLKRDKGKYYLQAENASYPDMYAVEELQTAGVIEGIMRKY
jgi:SOS regulatory protein LexA